MKKIRVADATLTENRHLRFKEKLEIARQLENLALDVIELPPIDNPRVDTLFVRTAASFVKQGTLSVGAFDAATVEAALTALSGAAHPAVRIELPVSPVGMEYTCHKKPQKMLEYIGELVTSAKTGCETVTFVAEDATRADPAFLTAVAEAAVKAGADAVVLEDSAAEQLPDEFAAFAAGIVKTCPVPVGVRYQNKTDMAVAAAVLAARAGAEIVTVTVAGKYALLDTFADFLRDCGTRCGLSAGLKLTELHRTTRQIGRILENAGREQATVTASAAADTGVRFDKTDDAAAVSAAVKKMGYDLSPEDEARVYDAFLQVAAKKDVGERELEAIVANAALQVPETYRLTTYVVNSGNVVPASAQITLTREGKEYKGIAMGDGPIAAAFLTIEQIIGHHYELDDFQIQAVTEGKEAVGSALVKLRADGRLYAGNGISTDIIGASIRAYLSAVNKIIYEEEQA